MDKINRYGKLLPIGSVVKLKKTEKKIMIIGLLCLGENDENNRLYDYSGCVYPEGVLTGNKNILFNQEDIDELYYVGYNDNEERLYKKNINDNMNILIDSLRPINKKDVENG